MSEPLTVAELITALSRIDPTRIVVFDTEVARFPAHLIGITRVSDEVMEGEECFPVVLSADSADYIHGVEQPDWTTERPTEPGDYWLSKPPELRAVPRDTMREVVLKFTEWHPTELQVFDVSGSLLGPVKGTWLDGSKWSRRETPADPFEEG